VEAHAGRQRVAEVALANLPALIIRPGKLPARRIARQLGVNAKAARPRAGMVLLAHVREVNVADLILVVEGDEQFAVPDRNVTGHRGSLFGGTLGALARATTVACVKDYCRPKTPWASRERLSDVFHSLASGRHGEDAVAVDSHAGLLEPRRLRELVH